MPSSVCRVVLFLASLLLTLAHPTLLTQVWVDVCVRVVAFACLCVHMCRFCRRKVLQRIKELLTQDAAPVAAAPTFGAQTPTHLLTRPLVSLPGTPGVGGASCLSFSLTPQSNGASGMPAPPFQGNVAMGVVAIDGGKGPCEEILPALIDAEEVARRDKAEAETVRLRTVSTQLTQEVKDKMQAEDFCINEGQWAMKKIAEWLKRSSGWAVPGVRDALNAELAGLPLSLSVAVPLSISLCLCSTRTYTHTHIHRTR